MRVFISHASEDKSFVERLRHRLVAEGIEVWTDEAIQPGQDWARAIHSAIEASGALIAVISAASSRSESVSREVALALADRWRGGSKPIIPILVDRAAEVPTFLRDRKWLDLSDESHFESAVDQLVASLKGSSLEPSTEGEDIQARLDFLVVESNLQSALLDELHRRRVRLVSILVTVLVAATVVSIAGVGTILYGELSYRPFSLAILGFLAGLLCSFLSYRFLVHDRESKRVLKRRTRGE